MAGQEQKRPQRREDEDTPPPAAPVTHQQDSDRTAEVDDLLDEIDGVLETNAEEFVHGFVQKGGQ
ncbi:ubiquitin-like protein Pup [Ornithinimicrobium cryptoxanthini]|uniref:Prokaryotic ubiquitin-like protein Pup n=1 Tax=Ornithinimicrobium cryptoxanthini TaxID=2934161 RepID=A0ABY4YDH0_9MICO|nr:ubiquitin-like protein Pup [Ornithinimicrobium cryptoxanthini]USQ74818.1 ubiquitin-like protein Pup [Ornithinimicrobium cryptoxanthini]